MVNLTVFNTSVGDGYVMEFPAKQDHFKPVRIEGNDIICEQYEPDSRIVAVGKNSDQC